MSSLAFIVCSILAALGYNYCKEPAEAALPTESSPALHYQFSTTGILNETGSMNESSSPYFWLNSGGQMRIDGGVGKTIQDELGSLSKWRLLYAASNALDTDGGYQPQNLFRLITKGAWDNTEVSLRFNINELNMTDTPNRDGYSGILLMSRYQDGNNLYYAGIRMDGTAVIKKKRDGVYTTLSSGDVFSADARFNRDSNPTLIPGNTWIGIKSITKTESDGAVTIELWVDEKDTGNWEKVLTARDASDPVKGPAHAGIRTDYMDVFFDDFKVKEI